MLERLQKIIAHAGVASRRHAEELIASGLVTVNGQTITVLGSKADASRDHIKVSGKLLRPSSEHVYVILNKPVEVVATMSDPEGRHSLRDFLHGVSERVYPVGRLEYHSSGLVFLTNDGDIANRMLKSHRLPQVYHLKLKSLLTFAEIETLSRSTGARISRLRTKEMPWYEVTLSEASQDSLRNKLFQTGHPVEKLRRIALGNLRLESLTPGQYRTLSPAEVATLSRLLDGKLEPAAVTRIHSPKPARQSKHKGPGSIKRSAPNRSFRANQKAGASQRHGDEQHFSPNRGARTNEGTSENRRVREKAGTRQYGGRPNEGRPNEGRQNEGRQSNRSGVAGKARGDGRANAAAHTPSNFRPGAPRNFGANRPGSNPGRPAHNRPDQRSDNRRGFNRGSSNQNSGSDRNFSGSKKLTGKRKFAGNKKFGASSRPPKR